MKKLSLTIFLSVMVSCSTHTHVPLKTGTLPDNPKVLVLTNSCSNPQVYAGESGATVVGAVLFGAAGAAVGAAVTGGSNKNNSDYLFGKLEDWDFCKEYLDDLSEKISKKMNWNLIKSHEIFSLDESKKLKKYVTYNWSGRIIPSRKKFNSRVDEIEFKKKKLKEFEEIKNKVNELEAQFLLISRFDYVGFLEKYRKGDYLVQVKAKLIGVGKPGKALWMNLAQSRKDSNYPKQKIPLNAEINRPLEEIKNEIWGRSQSVTGMLVSSL